MPTPPTHTLRGNQYWYREDQLLHREDGPAIIYAGGGTEWWRNGYFHRIGGPAVDDLVGGRQEWWVDGLRHRDDGPAVIYTDGTKEWWLNNRQVDPIVHFLIVGNKE